METLKLTVNGREIETRPGLTLLELVREQGIDEIPTLCHSAELEPYGSCFVCVVELEGRPGLVPACATRVAAGMKIQTRSERVVAARRTALELLLSNHYADCVPPCRVACPAGVDTQGYLALAAMGQHTQAVDLIREANPLPAVCGRVCVRKCEVDCRRADLDTPVAINNVKRYVTDAPGVYDGAPAVEPPTGKRIAVVGAGPAGLSAAWFLARKGHAVTMYEAMPRAGGMLRYGIPAYRLPDDVLDREVAQVLKTGAELKLGVRVGEHVTLGELRANHDAVFLAAGAWAAKPMGVEGEHTTEGIVSGIDFLRDQAVAPTPVRGIVVVVGGGNTAIDVARTAWRVGAEKVVLLYRRTRAEMPADPMEIEDAVHEGVELMELAAPVGIVAEAGRLKALRCIRMTLGEPDRSGRRRPVPLEGSEFDLPCQLAVSAIGQDTALRGLDQLGEDKLGLTRWKTITVDRATMATNLPGVYAGGDAADDGPTVVIDAVRDGHKAARGIHAFLTGRPMERAPFVVTKAFWGKPGRSDLGEVRESPRHEVHQLDVERRRGSFAEVATGFEPEDNAHETARCLSCGCVRYADCSLRLYAEEYSVDMERFKGQVRKHKVDDRHPYLSYDPNKCVLCARCVRTCARVLPLSALGLVNRGFRTEVRPAMNDPLTQTSCVSCGNCVDSCPTGALTIKYAFAGRAALATSGVTTHCAFCSVGCDLTVERFGAQRYFVRASGQPGDYLCRYGRFGVELFLKRPRLLAARLRSGATSRELSYDEAFAAVARGVDDVVSRHGPESVAVLVSPDLTNEELYLAGRLARDAIGTRNIASLASLLVDGEAAPSVPPAVSTADRSVLADADLIVCDNTALQQDHLVLGVPVIDAVRRGARLLVVTSASDPAEHTIATMTLDPLRGTSSKVWAAVIELLAADGHLGAGALEPLRAGAGWPAGEEGVAAVVAETGLSEAQLRAAAKLVAEARRVVFIHGVDRPRDRASGSLALLGNLTTLLRGQDIRADLLLPRLASNGAGLELAGADPAFGPGRVPLTGLKGAATRGELRQLLEGGRLRAAIVIGEDPMRHDETASWLRDLEFLVAVDWTETETTRAANVVLPGATFLETEGTRCNFEGRVLEFSRALEPAAGLTGFELLRRLMAGLGVAPGVMAPADARGQLEQSVREHLGDDLACAWNTGERRAAPRRPLGPVSLVGSAPSVAPAITHADRYRKAIQELGTERFRVT